MWRSIAVMAPPVIAGFAAVAILGYLGRPLTIMHIISLLMVLGIGVDYAVYLAESTGGSSARSTDLAVVLSASTTLLAFGMLLFSSAPVLQAIGEISCPAIALAFLFAGVAAPAAPPRT
jgi:predicted exporter